MSPLFQEFKNRFSQNRNSTSKHFKNYDKAFQVFQWADRLSKNHLEDEDLEQPAEIIN